MFPGIYQKHFFDSFFFFFLQGGFAISDIVFGCDDPTDNPSPVQELDLLTQFSGFTTLQSLVLAKHCKEARSSMIYEEWRPHI